MSQPRHVSSSSYDMHVSSSSYDMHVSSSSYATHACHCQCTHSQEFARTRKNDVLIFLYMRAHTSPMLPQHHIKKGEKKKDVLFAHPPSRSQVLPQHHIQLYIQSSARAASAGACQPPPPLPFPLALSALYRANMLFPLRAARTNCTMCWVWVWVLGAS